MNKNRIKVINTKDNELFIINNENISYSSTLNNNEKILNIRLFNTKSSLQSAVIAINFPATIVKSIRRSKNNVEEIKINDKEITISLRPKEILTLSFPI